MSETLWTGTIRCGVCKEPVSEAKHVPENEKTRVELSAPFAARCKKRDHNTYSDINFDFKVEWEEEAVT